MHSSELISETDILAWASNFLLDFRSANFKEESSSVLLQPAPTWSAPSFGCYKINTDAALCSSSSSSGLGIVIRD